MSDSEDYQVLCVPKCLQAIKVFGICNTYMKISEKDRVCIEMLRVNSIINASVR